MSEEKFLTVSEVAAGLRCSVATVRRYIKARKLPGVKRGGVWLVSKNDLNQFLEKNKTAE